MNELRHRKHSSKIFLTSPVKPPLYSTSVPLPSNCHSEASQGLEAIALNSLLKHSNQSDSPADHILLVSNTGVWWMNLSITRFSSPKTPVFHVQNTSLSRKIPSVVLSKLSSSSVRISQASPNPTPELPKSSKLSESNSRSKALTAENQPQKQLSDVKQTLGILQLTASRNNPFALTSSPAPFPSLQYWNLRRISDWSHKIYTFQFNDKTYIWTRTRCPVLSGQPDLELREKDGDGTVLAEYNGQLTMRTRGVFKLRRRDELRDGADNKEFGDWELTVLLTGCGIIDASRRRARMRRGFVRAGGFIWWWAGFRFIHSSQGSTYSFESGNVFCPEPPIVSRYRNIQAAARTISSNVFVRWKLSPNQPTSPQTQVALCLFEELLGNF
ncbi:hypothetical protein B0O99DRAFT_600258 [Bisporella sp. PMI_857]|nr:hypothetical protein B0O99DRAFT_600258 [Bisporella sp. PMI_857]